MKTPANAPNTQRRTDNFTLEVALGERVVHMFTGLRKVVKILTLSWKSQELANKVAKAMPRKN
ncbi:MAG: hypothetical protein EBR17_02870 [Betaproteobacteria bacterium]|jgi:hypothetical protein|nr:hypothetical protein [Betaproteobacteria bacterium]